jgi:hypothetical protein
MLTLRTVQLRLRFFLLGRQLLLFCLLALLVQKYQCLRCAPYSCACACCSWAASCSSSACLLYWYKSTNAYAAHRTAAPALVAAGPPVAPLLPAGWEAAWSEADKDYYYYRDDTGQVTWDRPLV